MKRSVSCQWAVLFLTFGYVSVVRAESCPREALHRCVKMAEPLLHNIDYVFPSRKNDVAAVCRTWNEFISCVRSYTASCLVVNDQRQQQLENALAEAVKTVDEMCTNPRYQEDYLKHAPCIKSLATDDAKCQKQFNNLVTQVSAFSISNVQICCAHHAFRECMLAATDMYCRSQSPSSAVQFARDMFSKALGFLLKQCHNYVPNSSDCPSNRGQNRALAEDPWLSSAGVPGSNVPLTNDLVTRQSYQWTRPTTRRPWTPSSGNSLDSPKQQGLFSSGKNSGPTLTGHAAFIIVLSLMLTAYFTL